MNNTTPTTNRVVSRRSLRRTAVAGLAAAATVGLGLVGLSGMPAQADVLDDDRPRVTESHFDFGVHWTISGPRDGGYLYWDQVDGDTWPELTGYLYLTDRECGRVRVEYYDTDDSHEEIGSRNGPTYCAPGNGKTQWWVDIDSYHSTRVDHVHVIVQEQLSASNYIDRGEDVEDLDP